jgi:hypothetical protein
MRLLLTLVLTLSASVFAAADAPPAMLSPKAIPVKVSPDEDARTLFYLQRRERAFVYEQHGANGEWTRIKVKRGNKWVQGYVISADLYAQAEPDPEASRPHTRWALGLGLTYSGLYQIGKTFETDDEVKYTLSNSTSNTTWPYIVAQYGEVNFWRARIGYRLITFKGLAITDVNSIPRNVVVTQKALLAALEKAWTFKNGFYLSFGLEGDRGQSISVKLGDVTLPTSSSNLQSYIGAVGSAGWQYQVMTAFSLFTELHALMLANSSAPIYGYEATVAGLYWF